MDLQHCQFLKPASGEIVDLLLGVDNVHLHSSLADIRGKNDGPISRLRPLGCTCVGITSEKALGRREFSFSSLPKEGSGG